MKIKEKLFVVSIWWAVIGASIWLGGTVYMMLVINPQWSCDPPFSVKYFFLRTDFNKYIWNFFGPPFMLLRSVVPQLLALVLAWKSQFHRKYLLITLLCTVVTIIFTLAYIYPINDVLMFKAGGNNTAETIRQMVKNWLLADRIRFMVNMAGFFSLLKAFREPIVF